MSDLVFIAFPTEQQAEEVRNKVLSLQREYLIDLEDAVVAIRQPDGKVNLKQSVSMVGTGAASGTNRSACTRSIASGARLREKPI